MKNWERYKYELLDILIESMCLSDGKPMACANIPIDDCSTCDYANSEKCLDDWERFNWLFTEYDGNDDEEPRGFARELKNKLIEQRRNHCLIANTACPNNHNCMECELIEGKKVYYCPATDNYCIYEDNYKNCTHLNSAKRGCFLEEQVEDYHTFAPNENWEKIKFGDIDVGEDFVLIDTKQRCIKTGVAEFLNRETKIKESIYEHFLPNGEVYIDNYNDYYCEKTNNLCEYTGFCEDCPDISEEQREEMAERRRAYVAKHWKNIENGW